MIARIVEKDMDERQHRILQKSDRRGGVDGFDLDHPGLTSCQVECAMNIDALTSAGLLNRQLVLLGRPAADRSRRMGRVHGVPNRTASLSAKEFKSFSELTMKAF